MHLLITPRLGTFYSSSEGARESERERERASLGFSTLDSSPRAAVACSHLLGQAQVWSWINNTAEGWPCSAPAAWRPARGPGQDDTAFPLSRAARWHIKTANLHPCLGQSSDEAQLVVLRTESTAQTRGWLWEQTLPALGQKDLDTKEQRAVAIMWLKTGDDTEMIGKKPVTIKTETNRKQYNSIVKKNNPTALIAVCCMSEKQQSVK